MRDLIGALLPGRRGRDWPATVEAVRAGAAYLGQGASYSWLRARTLLAGPRLFADEGFGMALTICKWEAFGVAAQDLILILEAELRPLLPADPRVRAPALAALYREALAAEPVPAHRRDWADLEARFDGRLLVFLAGAPRGPDAISAATAEAILAHAPIDAAVREADREMVTNNTAFRFIEHQSQLRRKLDYPAVAAALSARMKGPAR